MIRLTAHRESWPIAGQFRISRGAKTEAEVVIAVLNDGRHAGRGECVPYPRYGETIEGVLDAIEGLEPAVAEGLDREALQKALSPGAARNALDCAFWDLEAKRQDEPVWSLAGLSRPSPVVTSYTISLDEAESMAKAAAERAEWPVLKLKLTGPGDLARVRAVRQAAPEARLIIDANEAWTPELLVELAPVLQDLGVELIEQPLPAGEDAPLAELDRPVPVCADESCHDRESLPALAGRYDAVNIKLDKTGGLTEALALARDARAAGHRIMVGCMVGTSLGMAPALLVAQGAEYVDLDGPLLLARDRHPGLRYDESVVYPPERELWGA